MVWSTTRLRLIRRLSREHTRLWVASGARSDCSATWGGSCGSLPCSPLTSSAQRITARTFSIADKPLVPGVGLGKTSTGLVGLPVDHDAIPKIIAGNEALLAKMAASDMPETAQYRINVEAIARYRIKVCQENPDDPEKVEELVGMGQVEELVLQADDEMDVLDMYLESRLWEKIKPNEVEIEYDPDPMEDQSHMMHDEDEEKKEGA